jgi:arylsulfatase A-like enzyme
MSESTLAKGERGTGSDAIFPAPIPSLLLVAAWFGLLTGFGEVSLLAAKRILLQQFIRFGPNLIWMAPLSDLLFFIVPGLILALVAWRWPKAISVRTACLVFAFLSFLSLLLLYSKIHVYAALLLASGLAVQTSRIIAKRPQRFLRLVRKSLVWTLALAVASTALVYGWQNLAERRALAKLPSPPPGAPNVLLIVLDTVRAQNLSLHGYQRPTTPRLESFSKRGARFELAMAAAPWTLPSHASMFTGQWPHELSADWFKSLDDTHATLAETLSAHGYATAGFVANTFYCGYETGLSRGFAHYEDYKVSPQEVLLSSSLGRTIANNSSVRRVLGYERVIAGKDAASVNADFLNWLSRDRQRPFFAFLNYFDAHEVYLPPKPFYGKFSQGRVLNSNAIRHEMRRSLRQDWPEMSPQEVQAEVDAYDETIAYLDYQLGQLFDELQRRSVLDNTLVIITSDHGEQFGEHRLFMHGNSLYSQLLHVPLLLALPSRVPAGVSVPEPVSLRDLPATVLDLVGIENSARLPGGSLARYWDQKSKSSETSADALLSELTGGIFGREWYPAVKGDMKSLVVGQYHYIKNGDGSEELYDLKTDPLELKNLAASDSSKQLFEKFRASVEHLTTPGRSD